MKRGGQLRRTVLQAFALYSLAGSASEAQTQQPESNEPVWNPRLILFTGMRSTKRITWAFLLIATTAVVPCLWPQTARGPGRAGRGGADPNFWAGKKKLLAVADVQTGFHHDSISHAL